MRKHIIALALIVALGTGVTLTKQNAYAKSKQQPITQAPQDGVPHPVCPPPPMPCQ
jgi:hypothetical protein